MTRQQWEGLKSLFHGALSRPAEERNQWLSDHAGGDEMLIREASALLAAHDTADRFLEVPVDLPPGDLQAALRLEASGDPLGALERNIASSFDGYGTRASGARGRADQLIESIVRGIRRLLD